MIDRSGTDLAGHPQRRWIVAAFVAAIALQLELVFNRPINWDEFYHLSQTHAFVDGRLGETLQVFYARLFFWVALLPLDAIDQLRVARLAMFGCELFATYAVYAMASRFTDRISGALAALAYLTGGYVLQHGFSYRADPLATAFLMGSLWILLTSKLDWKAILGIAALVGLAALTTIKILFYAPTFAGVAWLRWSEAGRSRGILARLAALGAATVASIATFVGLTMLSVRETGQASAARTISSSASSQFREGLFPQGEYLLGAITSAPFLALFVVLAPFAIARAKLASREWIALAGFMLTLASIAVYRNSFPYFYVFVLPPVMIAAAFAIRAARRVARPELLAAILVINAALVSFVTPRAVLPAQRQVIATVHALFPQPVAYFDFPGMIVDYPKANFFMSSWGVRRYRAGQFESFREVMHRETVPLLLLNQKRLIRNQIGPEPSRELLPRDAAALREGFIEHWGPIWVAGRHFKAGEPAREFEIFAPGTYTLEGAAARIDGRGYRPGDTLALERGLHRFEPIGQDDTTLRWGDHLERPTGPYSGLPMFDDF